MGNMATQPCRLRHGCRHFKSIVQNGNLEMTASLRSPAVRVLQCWISLPDEIGLGKGTEISALKGAAWGYAILCYAGLMSAPSASKGTASNSNALQHPLPVAEWLTPYMPKSFTGGLGQGVHTRFIWVDQLQNEQVLNCNALYIHALLKGEGRAPLGKLVILFSL